MIFLFSFFLLGSGFLSVQGGCPLTAKEKMQSSNGGIATSEDVPQTAEGIQADIWDKIVADTTSKGYMSTMKTGIKAQNQTYLRLMGDYQNGDTAIDGSDHEKITHGIGGHAKVHFEWFANEYTGLFQRADYCIARIANAAKPAKMMSKVMTSYNPNMAIKCFRDHGMESANIQTIWEIDGYDIIPGGNGENKESCSFFDVPLANHCGKRDNISAVLKSSFVRSFQKVDDNSMWLGVSSFAKATQNAAIIDNFNFPFALVFNPVADIKDSKCDFDDSMEQLKSISETHLGKPIYEIYAVKDPWSDRSKNPDLKYLGNMILDSAMVSSMFGDTELFFRHTFFDDELSLVKQQDIYRHSVWDEYAHDKDMNKQEGAAWYMPYL